MLASGGLGCTERCSRYGVAGAIRIFALGLGKKHSNCYKERDESKCGNGCGLALTRFSNDNNMNRPLYMWNRSDEPRELN
jgi:hypothetical protein